MSTDAWRNRDYVMDAWRRASTIASVRRAHTPPVSILYISAKRHYFACKVVKYLEMSTIASPRVSTSVRSPSSTRTSFDGSGTARPATHQRRNRAALRDYYGLKASGAASDAKGTSDTDQQTPRKENFEEDETLTELDKEGFDADAFVNNILSTSGLEGVLKVEADLVSRELLCAPKYSLNVLIDLWYRNS